MKVKAKAPTKTKANAKISSKEYALTWFTVILLLIVGSLFIGWNVYFHPALNVTAQCTGEGESIPVIASPPSCCSGLTLIPPRQEHIIGSEGICTARCGNGICDSESETAYNCPRDCNNSTSLANPASVNCIDKGGSLRIVTQEDGGQMGICTLADGVTECEEWAYYHGTCGNNESAVSIGGGSVGLANPASVNCETKGGTLRIKDTPKGQVGICTLADGVTECEEWAYYRGECGNNATSIQ